MVLISQFGRPQSNKVISPIANGECLWTCAHGFAAQPNIPNIMSLRSAKCRHRVHTHSHTHTHTGIDMCVSVCLSLFTVSVRTRRMRQTLCGAHNFHVRAFAHFGPAAHYAKLCVRVCVVCVFGECARAANGLSRCKRRTRVQNICTYGQIQRNLFSYYAAYLL